MSAIDPIHEQKIQDISEKLGLSIPGLHQKLASIESLNGWNNPAAGDEIAARLGPLLKEVLAAYRKACELLLEINNAANP